MATRNRKSPAKTARRRKPATRKARTKGYRLVAPDGKRVSVPAHMQTAVDVLAEAIGRGVDAAVIPTEAELTTQQAADLLNVSRQYVVRLVDEGKLPATKTGAHRRLRVTDVLSFKASRDAALEEILSIGKEQKVGGYYDDWKPRKGT